METKNQVQAMYGRTKKLTLPSGFLVTIREQNGHDDDIISNQALAKDLANINTFISTIVVETDLPFAIGGKLNLAGVKKLTLRDKYFIIFSSRIHSIGNEIAFEYDWGQDNGGKVKYTDDLNNFIWDYTKEMPTEESSEYYPYRLLPYSFNPYEPQELTLSSGKVIRYNCLNGDAEAYLMKLTVDKQTKSTELKARGIQQQVEGNWVNIENFLYFTKKDMTEIYREVNTKDEDWKGVTELENPISGEPIHFPIIATPDFFFPAEI